MKLVEGFILFGMHKSTLKKEDLSGWINVTWDKKWTMVMDAQWLFPVGLVCKLFKFFLVFC